MFEAGAERTPPKRIREKSKGRSDVGREPARFISRFLIWAVAPRRRTHRAIVGRCFRSVAANPAATRVL